MMENKRLAIIGAGDLGELVAHHAETCGFNVVGFFDDTKKVGERITHNSIVIGGVKDIKNSFEENKFDLLFVAIGYKHIGFREGIFNQWKGKIAFANIIHPNVYIDESVELGEGIFLLPGCTLDMGVKIEDNVLLNTGCTIAHDSTICRHSFLSPAVKMAGFSIVGERCNIGIGTVIIDNIEICADVQTGGGAVVVSDISSPGLYIGVPAKNLK